VVFASYVTLEAEDVERITGSYDFQPGIHKVKVTAEVNGKADSDSATYCVTGVTNNYKCSMRNVVREAIRSGCTSTGEIVERCAEACAEGVCLDYDSLPGPNASCPVEITSLDYVNNIVEGENETIGVGVKNTGDASRIVELKLYVDGNFRERKGLRIASGSSAAGHFQFSMQAGSRQVRIDAVACGQVSESKTEVINVRSRPVITPPITVHDNVPPSPQTDAQGQRFSMQIIPEEINASPCQAAVLTVKAPALEALDKDYNVLVTGIESDLLDYPKTVNFAKAKSLYILILAPQEQGVYQLRVKLSSGGESAESSVKLIVSGKAPAQTGQQNPLTGFFAYAQSDLILYLLLGIIMATTFVILIKRCSLQRQNKYDFEKLEYDMDVRRRAI
jgi:hypothetical protein